MNVGRPKVRLLEPKGITVCSYNPKKVLKAILCSSPSLILISLKPCKDLA